MGLFNSTILDWAIGLVFVYLLLAIICTNINEWIAGIASLRAKTLFKAITQLLDDPKNPTATFLAEFYKHPLIAGMMPPGEPSPKTHPSYLSARTFATVVMDLATNPLKGTITFADLEAGAKKLSEGDVKTALLALLQNADNDLTRAQKNIENWFDDSMERASGWYKRSAQVVTIVVASLLTIGTNADTVRIGHLLWTNSTLRATLVEKAKNRSTTGQEASSRDTTISYHKDDPLHPIYQPKEDELSTLKPLLGWQSTDLSADWKTWASRVLGWFLSITAISLGAPFWFDLLNKVMRLRNTGQKPEKADEQSTRTTRQKPSPAGAGG